MPSTNVHRRLAAILAADVVGYSRLTSADEVGTLEALKAHRREMIDPAIALHHGRIVKTTGDGALVEFASVVDAVGYTVVVQRAMISRNANVTEDRRIVFRIGIDVGDIIIDGDDIFGDSVNIGTRLEALCEPGGVCISRARASACGRTNTGPTRYAGRRRRSSTSRRGTCELCKSCSATRRSRTPFDTWVSTSRTHLSLQRLWRCSPPVGLGLLGA